MKKRWVIFWLAEAAGLAVFILPWRIVPAAVFCILSVIWWLYYHSLEYTRSNNCIIINSGVIFRRKKILPPENILWKMRLGSPLFRGDFVTVLHTSGGIIILFCDFST